jgi:hypothetical protein
MPDRPRSLLTWRWYLLVAAVYVAGLISLGVALRNNVGFPLDDSWIHQEIARNLVQLHSYGFTPGVTSSGSSSTLWTLILALHYLFFPSHSPVFFPLILNSILMVLSGVLLWRMAALDGLPVMYVMALAMLPALCGNFVWLAFIGMEHALFVTLSLAAIVVWFREGSEATGSARSAVLAGVTLGALGTTRPEGLALSVMLFALYKWCGRSFANVVRAGVAAVLFLIPSFLINLKTSGSLLPLTLRGRRFLYLGSDKLHIGRSTVRGLVMETYHKVIQHNFFHTTSGWAAVGVALAFYGCFVLLRRFPNRTSLVVLWATLHYAAYCFTLPSTGHGGRYQPFVFVLFPALIAIALFDLAGRMFQRPGGLLKPVQALLLVCVGMMTAATLPRWSMGLRDSIYDINHCHKQMAIWLNEHYPAGTGVGVYDIGAIAYFSHMNIVDLGGLVDPKFFGYLLANRVPQYLDEKGAKLVILPTDGTQIHFGERLGLLNNPAIRLEAIHTEAIDYDIWLSGNLYSQHAYQYETLFRIVPVDANAAGQTP